MATQSHLPRRAWRLWQLNVRARHAKHVRLPAALAPLTVAGLALAAVLVLVLALVLARALVRVLALGLVLVLVLVLGLGLKLGVWLVLELQSVDGVPALMLPRTPPAHVWVTFLPHLLGTLCQQYLCVLVCPTVRVGFPCAVRV